MIIDWISLAIGMGIGGSLFIGTYLVLRKRKKTSIPEIKEMVFSTAENIQEAYKKIDRLYKILNQIE